jgi:hypothetical protein
MHSVKINRVELLKIVLENKTKHVAEYEEALVDYKACVVKLAKENLKLAESGELPKIARMKQAPQAPTSYEDNYIRAIRMLKLSVDDVIELQEDEFNQLVLDEWAWKRVFSNMRATYKSL